MPIINVTLPSDGTGADVGDYNSVVIAMLAVINGFLDDSNIVSLSGTKITAGTLPISALNAAARSGFIPSILPAPNTITNNGNRSFTLVFTGTDVTGYISNGMRLRATRTVTAPTQCTLLNGTTQFWSKAAPSATTFTDDFAVDGFIKLTSYAVGTVISRFDGTSGWQMSVNASGQLKLSGYNGGAANVSEVTGTQSLPLNKWVRVSAELDMSSFTASPTTSYIMVDGIDYPAVVSRGGTNPTALVQAGNLNVGALNAGGFFSGKIAQIALFNAKVTQATLRSYASQTYAGNETSLISAYSFNNNFNDLNGTSANNLTANGAVTATNADSPYAGGAVADNAYTAGTTEFGLVMSKSFSADSTVVVQVPEGYAFPTSGGISALAYSIDRTPLGFPVDRDKWGVNSLMKAQQSQGSPTINVWYNVGVFQLTLPIGAWDVNYAASGIITHGGVGFLEQDMTLSTANNTESDSEMTQTGVYVSASSTQTLAPFARAKPITVAAATPYFLNSRSSVAASTNLFVAPNSETAVIKAIPAGL